MNHENTKSKKHEMFRAYFRVFVLSCFRDEKKHPPTVVRLPSTPVLQYAITPAYQGLCLWPSRMALPPVRRDRLGPYDHVQSPRLTAVAISARCIFFAFYPDLDNIGRSANPWIDLKRTGRTIGDTGTALHAGVKIDDSSLSVLHFHDALGADMGANATANAFFRV